MTPCGETRGLQEKKIRQRPTLPRGFPRSTIGSGGLNFRVRDGNGWDPSDIATGKAATVHTKGMVKPTSTAKCSVPSSGPGAVRSRALARGLDPGLDSRPDSAVLTGVRRGWSC